MAGFICMAALVPAISLHDFDSHYPMNSRHPRRYDAFNMSGVVFRTTREQMARVWQPSIERFLMGSTHGSHTTTTKLTTDLQDIVVKDDLTSGMLWLSVLWLRSHPNYHVGRTIQEERERLFALGQLNETIIGPNVIAWVELKLNTTGSVVRETLNLEKEFAVGFTKDQTGVAISNCRRDGSIDRIAFPRSKLLDIEFNPEHEVAIFRLLKCLVTYGLPLVTPLAGDEPSRRSELKDPSISVRSPRRWSIFTHTNTTLRIQDERRGFYHVLPRSLYEDPTFDVVEWVRERYAGSGRLPIEDSDSCDSGRMKDRRCLGGWLTPLW